MVDKEVIRSLAALFERDLLSLEAEIAAYPEESALWTTDGTIKNGSGNLAMHLCGNLQHYVGRVLGGTKYQRNRDNEFAARNVPRTDLLTEIKTRREVVAQTLNNLNESALDREYPEHVFDYSMTTVHFLFHLLGHLNYHLGQVNYHRRLLS